MSDFINNTIEPSALTQSHLDDFGFVLYEIDNCRRQIAVFLEVGKKVSKNKNTDVDNLCGWTQDAFLRLVVIDSLKIRDGSKKIIKSIIDETKYSSYSTKLFKASQFDKSIKLLDEIIKPWRPQRNKRYAHMEKEQLNRVSLELIALAGCLKNLKNSANFIIHYLNNPRSIHVMEKKDEAPYILNEEDSTESAFYEQMKNDCVVAVIHQIFNASKVNPSPINLC